MSVSISGVHVTVDDPDAALAFYRDTLGMTVRGRVDQNGGTWITLATETQPAISVVLSLPHGGRSKEDGDAIAALLAKGALNMLQLTAKDLDATFEKMTGAPGVEILQEPMNQFWGARDFAVRDPAGNMIRVAQA